jgi:hypothetical protein
MRRLIVLAALLLAAPGRADVPDPFAPLRVVGAEWTYTPVAGAAAHHAPLGAETVRVKVLRARDLPADDGARHTFVVLGAFVGDAPVETWVKDAAHKDTPVGQLLAGWENETWMVVGPKGLGQLDHWNAKEPTTVDEAEGDDFHGVELDTLQLPGAPDPKWKARAGGGAAVAADGSFRHATETVGALATDVWRVRWRYQVCATELGRGAARCSRAEDAFTMFQIAEREGETAYAPALGLVLWCPLHAKGCLRLEPGAAARPAAGGDRFLGWSADGSFYARSDGAQTLLCLTDSTAPSATWPAEVAARPGRCTPTSDAAKWVAPAAPAPVGPHGETLTVGAQREITVRGAGQVELGLFQVPAGAAIAEVTWRPSGYAAAVVTTAPRQLLVIAWRGPADAAAANTKGVRLLKDKDYDHAREAFDRALAADAHHVRARYNRACARALAGDRAGAAADLRWLDASTDPAAHAALAKAGADPDLASVRADPQVKAVLDANGGCAGACAVEEDRCEQACAAGDGRACMRACGARAEECGAKCGAK